MFAAKPALEDDALKCARVIWVDSDATFHVTGSSCGGEWCATTVRSVRRLLYITGVDYCTVIKTKLTTLQNCTTNNATVLYY